MNAMNTQEPTTATTELHQRALRAAALVLNPAHPTAVATALVCGRPAVLGTCPCGWQVARESVNDVKVEAALHRLAPGAWRELVGTDFAEADPAGLLTEAEAA